MKKIANWYIRFVQRILPSPITIAFGLTALCAILALLFTQPSDKNAITYGIEVFGFWGKGIWGLLEFTAQMMLILVLGHSIALSRPANKVIDFALQLCTSNARTALVVSFFTIIAGFMNWGLGLIFGAILARKAYEYTLKNGININYPLIGACGYLGMMVWHGGLSGSAPLTVAQTGHSLETNMGIVDLTKTVFSRMNVVASVVCLTALPLLAFFLGKQSFEETKHGHIKPLKIDPTEKTLAKGAEQFDHYHWPGLIIGFLLIVFWLYSFITSTSPFSFIGINSVNLLFFGMALLSHGSISSFVNSVDEAIKGASGILIQFPLYAGIMGILQYSGLLELTAVVLVKYANAQTFPVISFISASIVNILVPSGGGQWQIQGPILIEAAKNLGVDFGKTTMSLAYGDQLTNMLQPFWALPLMSITQLKAKDILPYSLLFMIVGGLIFLLALILL